MPFRGVPKRTISLKMRRDKAESESCTVYYLRDFEIGERQFVIRKVTFFLSQKKRKLRIFKRECEHEKLKKIVMMAWVLQGSI